MGLLRKLGRVKFLPLLALGLALAGSPALSVHAQPSQSQAASQAPSQAPSQANAYYDEIFDSQGQLRPVYEDIYPIYQSFKKSGQEAQFLKDSRKDFQGDNALDPLPRMLSESEYQELKYGVEQRGTALRRLLQDYYAGNWASITQVIPRPVLERIVARAHESSYVGRVNPESISFPYGPDIIRDQQGHWRVVEDNPGYIGGPGDLIRAREILLDRMPEYRDRLEAVDSPEKFYDELVTRFRSLRKPPNGRVVLYMVPPYPDHEDDRLKAIFANRGVDVVTPFTKKKLVATRDGLFLEEKIGASKMSVRSSVGYIILNGEHAGMDSHNPASRERALIEEAVAHIREKGIKPAARARIEAALVPDPSSGQVNLKKLKAALDRSTMSNDVDDMRFQAPGLLDAIFSGKVAANYSPGVDFIGDKEFYVYVDDLVRHYLKEEPVIKNIPTEKFLKPDGAVDQRLLAQVFKNPEQYVIKAVDGRGGDSVWVGAKIPKEEFAAVRAKILAEPDRYIVQKFTHLSVMDGKIVDIRMISAVDPKGVYVSATPWGRALPIEGDGKVNLSSNGREVAIVVTRKGSVHVSVPCVERNLAHALTSAPSIAP
ncbi:MAG: circularly permuted type 2 ATP-grasp protein [Oligoflexia bacterium]|nr:circularly permuted type 2 ATP-grasp protein [Oligoflexia bacterium]